MEICFMVAPGQNQFYVELVDALRDELDQLGVANRVAVGAFPEVSKDTVFVITPPHEHHVLTKPENLPSKRQLRRTIFICAQQPGTWYFKCNVELAEIAGSPVFDINRWSVAEYRRKGIKAEHFQLGWTRTWARHDPTTESPLETHRSVDVLHLGTRTDRREVMLSENARYLAEHDCIISLGDNTAPHKHGSRSWIGGEAKWDLLGDTRVLLNIHCDERPYFEWLRMIQAISNGAMIVSEWSLDCAPLISGEHMLEGVARDLGLVAAMPLRDEPYRHAMATSAYTLLRDALPMSTAMKGLLEVADSISSSSDRVRTELPSRTSHPTPHREIAESEGVFPEPKFDNIFNQVKQVVADPSAQPKLHTESGGCEPPPVEHVYRTPAYAGVAPRVSVITPLFNHEQLVIDALASATRSDFRDYELVIVDDGSTDRSLAAARGWLQEHPAVPGILLSHPTNRGRGAARNSAISAARGRYVFMLDADNTVYPNGISRLIRLLDEDPIASFAYGMLERQDPEFNSVGLLSSYAWDPRRFGNGSYIDAMVLWRTEAFRELGPFTTDSLFWGWEDYELFLRLADAGGYGLFEPQFVARSHVGEFSMARTMDISTIGTKLIEMYPQIMAPDLVPAR